MTFIKNSISFIIKNISIFIVCAIWSSFYIKDRLLALSIALLLTLLVSLLLKKFLDSKAENSNASKEEKLKKTNFKNFLKTATTEEKQNIIKLLADNKFAIKNDLYLYAENIVCFDYLSSTISKEEIIKSIKKSNSINKNKIIIFCNNLNDDCLRFCNSIINFEIQIIDSNEIYKKLKLVKYAFKQDIIEYNTSKLNWAGFFKLVFSKKNAKTFFFLGILTFLSSFFTFLKLYYYIWASLLLIFSIVCLTQKKEKSSANLI